MVLSPAGASTRLKILLDEKEPFECLLPARLDAFYQPGALVYDAAGSVSSLIVSQSVHGRQVVVPITPATTRRRELTSRKERGQDAFGKWLEKSVAAVREKTGVPALACAVADASAVVASAVAGVRKFGTDTPVGPTDQFHIGTVTKAFTSTLLAILIQEKKLTWATPLETLLPDLADSMHEAYRRMPLSFVAHEATGLKDDTAKVLEYGSKGNSLAELRTLWLKEVLRQPPAFTPGTKHEYRNMNYVVAGAIVDRLSVHETWEQSVRTKLFAPLEITTAGYGPMGLPGEDLQPWGHTREKGVQRPVWGDNAPSAAPAGSLHMSVSDLARFGQLHLSAELGRASLLSAAAFRDLHKPLFGYGKGWAVGAPDARGRYDVSHWGSNNLNTAEIIIRPGRGAAIAIATNESPYGEGHGGQVVGQLATLVLEQGLKLIRAGMKR
jgi:CubicO group peptidase (beta-lactamase class C family)